MGAVADAWAPSLVRGRSCWCVGAVVGAVAVVWVRLRVRGRGCGCMGAVAVAWARLRGRGCGCVGAVADALARLRSRLRLRGRYFAQLLNVMPRVRFRSVETGEDYADTLEKVKFTSLAWTHDNKVSTVPRYGVSNGF